MKCIFPNLGSNLLFHRCIITPRGIACQEAIFASIYYQLLPFSVNVYNTVCQCFFRIPPPTSISLYCIETDEISLKNHCIFLISMLYLIIDKETLVNNKDREKAK